MKYLATGFFLICVLLVFCAGAGEGFSEKKPAKLFVNVVVLDPSEAISKKLAGKIGKSKLPNFMKIRMTKKLGAAAGRIVQPTMVAEKMSAKMSVDMPKKMAGKGMSVDVKPHYLEGPYFVLQLQVKHVNSALMAEAKTENKSIGAKMQKFLNFIGAKNQNQLEAYLLPGLIEKKLPSMMTEMMNEKLSEKGVKAEAKVLPEEKQAKHQEATIERIRKVAAKI